MRLGNPYFSLVHVSSFVVNGDECTIYMDDGRNYTLMGREGIDELRGCLFGRWGLLNRNLDGAYFRIKRNGKFENICFSDLTDVEMDEILEARDVVWCRSICKLLAHTLKDIGDEFDIVCKI